MVQLAEMLDAILRFMERGGDVLILILILILVMWVLIFERLYFLRFNYGKLEREVVGRWEARSERRSWQAHQIRQALLCEAGMKLDQSLDLIKTFVAVCPLFGLLGTVTGMIEVFDVMAVMGTGSARAMAAGISKATIPTMAGMVGALTGVFAATYLERTAKMKRIHLEDQLTFDH